MITLKQNDTGIGIRATLSNENGTVDLTGANVLFLMGEHEIHAPIENASNGQVFVAFNKEQTKESGFYRAEFEVKFEDGRIETFPNDGYLKVHILNDLGGN